jgi:hypothetical protein
MTAPIARISRAERLTVGTSSSTGVAGLDVRDAAGFRIQRAAGSSVATVTVYEGDSLVGPWTACQCAGTDLTVDVSNDKSKELPVGMFACHFMLLVGNASGTIILRAKS